MPSLKLQINWHSRGFISGTYNWQEMNTQPASIFLFDSKIILQLIWSATGFVTRRRVYVPATSIKGSIIVNIADIMQNFRGKMTNCHYTHGQGQEI